jgi:twitching motility protein PilI
MRFLVPEGTVSELLHNTIIYHLPNAPRWLVGLINLHGNVIPVVDVASYVGEEISHIKKSNVLAIGRSEAAIGILIDGLPVAIKENDIITSLNAVPESLVGHITSGLYSEGYNWYEFDIYDLFKKLASNDADTDSQG